MNGDGIPDLVVTNGQAGTLSVLPGIGRNGFGTGFFNDAAATVIDVPGHPGIRANNDGFLVTNAGAIINAATLATVFPADPADAVRFVEPFTPPGSDVQDLFVTRADDSVALLTSATGDSYAVAKDFRPPGLTDPEALDVFQAAGALDVYVSQEGSELPLVFTVELGIPVSVPNSVGAERPQIAALEPLLPATIPVVPSLVAGSPPEDLVAGSTPSAAASATFDLAGAAGPAGAETESAAATVEVASLDSGGGDQEDAGTGPVGDRALSPFVIGGPAGDFSDAPGTPDVPPNPGGQPAPTEGTPDPLTPAPDVPLEPPPDRQAMPGVPGHQEHRLPARERLHLPPRTAVAWGQERRPEPDGETAWAEAARETLPELSDFLAVWWEKSNAAAHHEGPEGGHPPKAPGAVATDAAWTAYAERPPDTRTGAGMATETELLAAAFLVGIVPGDNGLEVPEEDAAPGGRGPMATK
jgi:hypothetical protein